MNSDSLPLLLPITVLLIEDCDEDTLLIVRELEKAGLNPTWQKVSTENEFVQALAPGLDLILSEYQLAQFDADRALELLKQSGLEIPFILVSGGMEDGQGAESLSRGATDYVLKDRLARLGPAARRSIEQARLCRERLAVERASDALAQRLSLAVAAAAVGIWEWDIRTHDIQWDTKMYELYGLPLGTPINYEVWKSFVHPEDYPRQEELLYEVARKGGIGQREFRIILRDGTERTMQAAESVHRDPEGTIISVVGINIDVSDRKRSENALRESEAKQRAAAESLRFQAQILDSVGHSVIATDPVGRIIYANRYAGELYGWGAEAMIGRDVLAATVPTSTHEQAVEIMNALAQGKSWTGEFMVHDCFGREFPVLATDTPLFDEKGNLTGIIGVCTDITERKKLEAQFLRAQRLESIGSLAGGIAHDLNNVLSPIIMSIHMLKEEETDPERLILLSTMEASAKRGADMVKQVLSFARGVEGQRVVVGVQHLVEELAGMIRETFPKNISCHTSVQRDLWPVRGDPTQIHQVLLNFCVNARDAMPAGGALQLTLRNQVVDEPFLEQNPLAKPGSFVMLEVSDSGHGIPKEMMDKIFDPFFTTKAEGKGTGLGLSTSLAIVKSHGGFLLAESTPGEGSRFQVFLPASLEMSADLETEDGELPRGQGEMVLLVDDEDSVRQVISRTLERYGYRVLRAPDGADALALYVLHARDIAVVLTDMMMPIMDGPTMIEVMTRINPRVRVIAASGIGSNSAIARAALAGVKFFLPKPYTAEQLLRSLREALA